MKLDYLSSYKLNNKKEVINEIALLKFYTLDIDSVIEIELVLDFIFKNVAHNLNVIYHELLKSNYNFCGGKIHNFEQPLLPPFKNTNYLIMKIDNLLKPFGYLPLSIKYFDKYVGG